MAELLGNGMTDWSVWAIIIILVIIFIGGILYCFPLTEWRGKSTRGKEKSNGKK